MIFEIILQFWSNDIIITDRFSNWPINIILSNLFLTLSQLVPFELEDLRKINNNEVEEKYYLLVGNNIYM